MEKIDQVNLEKKKKTASFQKNVGTVLKGGGITIVGKFFNNIIRFVLAVVLARVLGTAQLGYYSLSLSTLNIAMGIALFGLDAAVVRFVAVMQSREDDQQTWESIQIGIGISLLLSTIVGVFLYIFSFYLAEQVFNNPGLAPYLQLTSVFIPMMVVNDQMSNILKGFKRFDLSVLAQYIYQPVTRLVIIGVLFVIGLNAKTAIIAYCVASFTATGAMIYFLNRDFSLKRALRVSRKLVREMIDFSFPVWLSSLLANFRGNIQTLFLGSLGTISGVGIFSVASQITFVSSEISSSINVTAKPIIAELDDRGDIPQMERIYQLANKWIVIIQIPIFLVMVLFPEILLQIFGEEFTDGSLALIILAFGSLVKVGTGMGGIIIDMAGYTKLKLMNSILLVSSLIILNYLFIPRWGLVGAALAAVIGEAFVNILRLVEVYFIYKILPYNKSFYKPTMAAIGTVGVFALASRIIDYGSNYFLAGLNMAIMTLAYIVIIFLLGFTKEELDLFQIFKSKVMGKIKIKGAA